MPWRHQIRALRSLGLDQAQRRSFFRGETLVYDLPTESDPGIAILQWAGRRLRSGIIAIRDPGAGDRTLGRFRNRSFEVARAFGAEELEIFGGEILNARLEAILLRHGFTRTQDEVPDALGGGTMEILTRIYPV